MSRSMPVPDDGGGAAAAATSAPVTNHGDEDNDKEEEKEECPLCLDPLPIMTWRGTECNRLLCCGKMVCADCSKDMHDKTRQSSRRARMILQAEQQQQQGQTTNGVERTQELSELWQQLVITSKCPMCREDLPHNERERFNLVEQNAKQNGWAWAQYKLGKYYETGVGVPVNRKLAAQWYRKAADKGNASAQHEYGICWQFGKGVPKADTVEACKWYEKAAESGLALSAYQLGHILAHGLDGVPKDSQRGFLLLKHAAEQGIHEAQCDLAYCYEMGEGVPEPSLERSLYWNKQAAKLGNKAAMGNYAGNLLNYIGIQNGGHYDLVGRSAVPEALYWARRAVTSGNTDAQSLVHQLEQNISKACANCGKGPPSVTLKKCTRCKAVSYCGPTCQKAHWKAGHKRDCFDGEKEDNETQR